MPKLNIIYDVYPLGQWNQGTGYRTGIGRVGLEILKALLRRDDVAITLLSPNGIEGDVYQTLCNEVSYPYTFLRLENNTKSVLKLCGDFIIKSMRKYCTHEMRAQIKQLLPVNVNAGYSMPDTKKTNLLAEYTAGQPFWYFSPYYEPPLFIEPLQHVKKATFVHDIIPLKMPECFMNAQDSIRKVQTIAERTDLVFTNSAFTREDMLSSLTCFTPEKIHVAYLACDVRFSRADEHAVTAVKAKYGIPPEKKYFLTLSTLEPRKGLLHVLKAFEALCQKRPDASICLVLAGQKGWKCDEITKSASKSTDKIFTTGFIADEDLPALYSGCEAFLYMSEYEGFGLPLLEAMSCGAPAVTANTTSLPEVAGDAALALPPRDLNALCQAMLTLLDDPQLSQRLRLAGIEQAKAFSWDNCAKKIVQVMWNS